MNTDDEIAHVRFSIRLPVALHRALEAEARSGLRSVNSLIVLKLTAQMAPGMSGMYPPRPPAQAVEVRKREPAVKGHRWPPDRVVSDDWIADGEDARREAGLPEIDLHLEAKNFANYWADKTGPGATKLGWHRTWINWARKATGVGNARQYGKSKLSDHPLGIFGELYGEAKQRR
jgi:hypothetical protein